MTFKLLLTAGAIALSTTSAHAATATLSSLLGGGSLVEGDVSFDGFAFVDFSDIPNFPEDTEVKPDEITVSTSSTATTATLTATFAPSIALSGDAGFFRFFLDFTANVVAPSTRLISNVELTGDVFHTGADGDAEVIFELGGFTTTSPKIEIFSASGHGTQTSDSAAPLAPTASLLMESQSEGQTKDATSTSGYSTFSLTFTLQGDPLPPDPPDPGIIPLPAGLPLLLGGLGGLGLLRRLRNRHT